MKRLTSLRRTVMIALCCGALAVALWGCSPQGDSASGGATSMAPIAKSESVYTVPPALDPVAAPQPEPAPAKPAPASAAAPAAKPAKAAPKAAEPFVLIEPTHPNLLENGDFSKGPEDELAGWEWWKASAISRGSDDVVKGALKVNCKPGDRVTFRQMVTKDMKPGKQYILQGNIKVSSSTDKAWLEIVREGRGTWAKTPVVAGDWKRTSVQFTAPPDTDELYVYLRYDAGEDPKGEINVVRFSNVELYLAEGKS